MPLLVCVLLVVAVHLATNLAAWTGVGLLADDRFAVGLPALLAAQQPPLSVLDKLELLFCRDFPPEQQVALYRPFVDLVHLCEYPLYGAQALGYHVTNSLLHCGTAVLWFVLVRRLSGSVAAALGAAVAFAGFPAHGEATHWIAARSNLLSTLAMVTALLLWDGAETQPRRARGLGLSLLAILAAVVAVGSKESAVLVGPLAVVVSWLRAPRDLPLPRRLLRVVLRTAPLAAAMLGWLGLRASVLHTWGVGAEPVWQLDVLSPLAWAAALWDKLALVTAPIHERFTAGGYRAVLWALHSGLVLLALRARRTPGGSRALRLAAAVLALSLVAIAGLKTVAGTLENARYTYEAALGLCTLLGLGIAVLPAAARGPALGLLVVVHALVLDGNRQSWLRAGALHATLEQELVATARSTTGPLRVVDAPGVYLGAFVYLVENPTLLLPPFAPPELAGRGRVSSSREWRPVLRELAALAAAGAAPHVFTVGWADGRLRPESLDGWPQVPWPDVRVAYARLGRQRPFVGSRLPVQVLARVAPFTTLQLGATAGARRWQTSALAAPASPDLQPVQLWLPLPDDLAADEPVDVELVLREPRGERRYAVGRCRPAAWSTWPGR